MAHKQSIKISEAKILVYLASATASLHFVSAIAAKTQKDYGYTLHILKEMHMKGWIKREAGRGMVYYFINKAAPLEKAKELLIK
jgi:DNA-binding MarR family transcriptional regulator